MELPFVLVGSVIAGGGLGYFLDLKLRTAPWMLLGCGLLGFLGGTWELLRRLNATPKSGSGKDTRNV
jgi:F0F1-type ATP synthase assembly protein I